MFEHRVNNQKQEVTECRKCGRVWIEGKYAGGRFKSKHEKSDPKRNSGSNKFPCKCTIELKNVLT